MNQEPGRYARVLLLEDDPSLRDVLSDVLSARGLDVSTASNGEDALNLASTQPFDLIIADIRMKGISGLDAIERARRLQPDLSSIVISGYASEDETLRAVRLNVAGYLKKPFKVPELLKLVNNLIEQRRAKKSSEEEVRNLRRSLIWAIRRQISLAELASPGEIERPAEIAGALAGLKGLSTGLSHQIFSGTGLRASLRKHKATLPGPVLASLEPFEALLSSLRGDEFSELAAAAVAESSNGELPTAKELEGEFSSPLLSLYEQLLQDQQALNRGPSSGKADEEIVETENLFTAVTNLEQLGAFSEALDLLEPLFQAQEISARAVKGHLTAVRLARKSGQTKDMEQHVVQAIAVAGELGPSTLAQVEWAAGEELRRSGHPVAVKLYRRAAEGLKRLDQTLPWACCNLALWSLGEEMEKSTLSASVQLLAEPDNALEIAELVDRFLPDLLLYAGKAEDPDAIQLAHRLVKGFYFETGRVLIADTTSVEVRALILDLLRESQLGLRDDWIQALEDLGESELRAKISVLDHQSDRPTQLPMRAYCFGGFRVTIGERLLTEKDWKTQKTKYLLARLLRSHPRPVQVDQLIEEFWPDKLETSRSSLNTAVSNLRRVFREALGPDTDAMVRVGETLGISSELKIWNDEHLFNEASRQADTAWEKGELERALSYYAKLIRLHEGAYLDGCYLDWALHCRTYYERQMELALNRLMEQRFSQHRYTEALESAKDFLRHQPDNIRAHEIIMLSLIGLERHPSAVTHFENFTKELKAEVGSEPPVELFRVYQMAKYGFRHQSTLEEL